MNTTPIFVFDDSRITDPFHRVVALTPDPRFLIALDFDPAVLPYARYVFCVEARLPDIAGPVVPPESIERLRSMIAADLDQACGAGAWQAIWIAWPRLHEDCRRALAQLHAALREWGVRSVDEYRARVQSQQRQAAMSTAGGGASRVVH